MSHTHTFGDRLFPLTHLCARIELLMSSVQDLRDAVSQVGVDLGEAVDRIETRLAESDVDLTPEIEALRGFSTQLDALGVETPSDPVEGGEGEIPPEEPFVP